MERLAERYILENLDKIFPGTKIVEQKKILLGNHIIDFHLVDQEGKNIFLKIMHRDLKRTDIGKILDQYAILVNISPSYKEFRLIVVGKDIDSETKIALDRLGIEFKTFSDLGLSEKFAEGALKDLKDSRKKLLDPLEAIIVSFWEAQKTRIVRVDDIVKLLGVSRNYSRQILKRLTNKKWLERLQKGIYIFIPVGYGYDERYPPMDPLLIGSILVEPYYFSYSTSNHFYGFTTQIRPVLFIATTKKRKSFAWRNSRFKFICISEHKFFGYKKVNSQGVTINIAEPEKSIVDSLDKLHYTGGIIETTSILYNSFRRNIDYSKLIAYAIRMHSYSLVQRLGFLIDFLQDEKLIVFPDNENKILMNSIGRNALYLAPTKIYGKGGKFNKEWRIIMNIDRVNLLGDISIR